MTAPTRMYYSSLNLSGLDEELLACSQAQFIPPEAQDEDDQELELSPNMRRYFESAMTGMEMVRGRSFDRSMLESPGSMAVPDFPPPPVSLSLLNSSGGLGLESSHDLGDLAGSDTTMSALFSLRNSDLIPTPTSAFELETPPGGNGTGEMLGRVVLPLYELDGVAVVRDEDGPGGSRGNENMFKFRAEEVTTLKDWAGEYNFKVTPVPDTEDKSGTGKQKVIYEPKLNKLFCNMGVAVPFKVQCNFGRIPASGFMLLASLVYDDSDSMGLSVERCPAHKQEENKCLDRKERLNHVLRPYPPSKSDVQYFIDTETGRPYLMLPLSTPPVGTDELKRLFCFACRNSCPRGDGKTRRATTVVFLLYDNRNCLKGRSLVKVRVCSAPTRDHNKEIKVKQTSQQNVPRKRKMNGNTKPIEVPAKRLLQTNMELKLSQDSSTGGIHHAHHRQVLRNTVVIPSAPKEEEVSSSQETVYSCDESEERINLRTLVGEMRWGLTQKRSPNLALREISKSIYGTLKVARQLCSSARAISADAESQMKEEPSPDGGYDDA